MIPIKLLILFPKDKWDVNMDMTRKSYIQEIMKHPDLSCVLSGPGWDGFSDILKVYEVENPQAIFWYKPMAMTNFDKIPFDIIKILNYNEMYSGTITEKEINDSKSDIIIRHHDVAGLSELNGMKINHPHETYYIPHCVSEKFVCSDSPRKIDLMVTGVLAPEIYPLRCRIANLIRARRFSKWNTFIRQHPGYWIQNSESQTKSYIDDLNQSKITVGCSSKYKYRLSKFSEYPACGTVLVGDLPDESPEVQEEIGKYSIILDRKSSDEEIIKVIEFHLKNQDELEKKRLQGLQTVNEKYRICNYVNRFVEILKSKVIKEGVAHG